MATNRIVLKVKLLSAFYEVLQAADRDEAERHIAAAAPDLVLLGSGLSCGTATSLVASVSPRDDQVRVPVMALLAERDSATRQHLLEAGIDDVMERPLDDTMLLARLRCLLRANQAERELRLRDGTRRALGLSEPAAATFEMPPRIALGGTDIARTTKLAAALKQTMPGASVLPDLRGSLLSADDRAAPDVFVVAIDHERTEAALGLISNIRARPHLRNTSILAVAPRGDTHLAAAALDQGASDLVPDDVDVDELALRLGRLTARKRTVERLRKTVENGLQAALIDPLTGLYNRRYAMPHLQRMAEHCRQADRSFAVMIADLDHFKRVNDRHGHTAGDAVLVETAQRLVANLRPVDLVARIGGEEFLVAMPDTDRAAARSAAERLCSVIAATPFAVPEASAPIRLTASIGVVLASGRDADVPGGIDTLIRAADRALYGSKSHGRNQFTLARAAA
nr:diguanylate cyclase [Pseudaestuariivita atlantica]